MTALMRNGRDRRSGKPVKCHARKERVLLFGTRSADYIRASGHSGCIQRPNTWLHPNASLKCPIFPLHRGRRLGHFELVGPARHQHQAQGRAVRRHAWLQLPGRLARLRPRRRLRLVGREGQRRLRPARADCETNNTLARHLPRPGRLCLRPLAALHHRRRRLRQRQGDCHDITGVRPGLERPRASSAGPSAPASNTPSSATGRPRSNISMSISAASTPVAAPFANNVSFKENIVRAGLNYKFSGPIFSRY